MADAMTSAVLPFSLQAEAHPEGIALRIGEEDYSYGFLAEQAAAVAGWLRSRGVGPPRRVGILATRSLTAYLGILGTCWAGAGYVPLNPDLPARRLQQIIELAAPEAIILESASLQGIGAKILASYGGALLLPDGPSAVMGDMRIEGRERMRSSQAVATPVAVSPESDAYLVFTSGTTGEPNGVAISVGNLDWTVDMMVSAYDFDREDRFSQFFDLSFDISVMDLFVPWRVGAGTYVVPAAQKLDPRKIIQESRLTVWTCIPSMISMMRRMKTLRPGIFPSLRLSCFTGEGLAEEAAKAWQEAAPNSRVLNLYGQTEAPGSSLVQEYGPGASVTADNGLVAIGKPLQGARAGILSAEGTFLGRGQAGELAVSGNHVARGYLNNPELSARKFPVLAPPDAGRRRWYRTGDLARVDDDGIYHFLGRLDNGLKVAGHRVMLEEIEFHLRRCAGGREGAVIPCSPGQGTAEFVIAFVAGTFNEQQVKEEMQKYLPRPLLPRRVVAIDELPLNANGKIDRKALARLWQARQAAG